MSEVKEYLKDRIIEEFENLKESEPGSEEHSRSVEDICKLAKVLNEADKLDYDVNDKEQRKEIEAKVREAEVKKQTRDRIVDICLRVAGITAPMFLYLVMFLVGLDFEKEGTIRSKFLNNFINKMLPTSFR